MSRSKLKIGETRGKLTIIEILPSISSRHGYVICSCICGGIRKIRVDQFRKDTSNGCNKCGKGFSFKPNSKLFRDYKSRANAKNQQFTLTFYQFEEFISKNCYYCNIEPVEHINKGKNTIYKFKSNGIDRLDSNLGYIIDNCVTSCGRCNIMKNNMKYKDFIEHINKIYKNLSNNK